MLLYIMLAYLMLLTGLLSPICLHNACLFFAIDFWKYLWFSCFVFELLTPLVYLECYLALYTVPLISWFS